VNVRLLLILGDALVVLLVVVGVIALVRWAWRSSNTGKKITREGEVALAEHEASMREREVTARDHMADAADRAVSVDEKVLKVEERAAAVAGADEGKGKKEVN
jgi:Tfp pilus assembly protein PilX